MNRQILFFVFAFAIFLLTSSLFALNVSDARAQMSPASLGGIDITPSTNNPIPGQTVTLTVKNFSINLNASKITWSVNGKVVQSGIGQVTYDVTAPPMGKTLHVTAGMTTPDGVYYDGAVDISSGSVDMIQETDGYVPPFFLGKLEPVYQNAVKIIAMPHLSDSAGKEYDPKTLVYAWTKNGNALPDQSGYGKQSIILTGDLIPRPFDVTVTVTSRDGTSQALGIAAVSFGSPSISFYVNDPLYGPLYNLAIGDTLHIGSQNEINVLAVPYGFNKPDKGLGDLTLSWLINNLEHPDLATNDNVILRAPGNTSGSSNIELDIKNNNQVLQGTNAGFTAMFSANNSSATSSLNF